MALIAVRREAGQSLTISTIFACAWPALFLATACLLPFLNKAFLIDDPEFLGMARQILKSPLRPMNFDICWNIAPYCVKAYQLAPGNSMMGYALVPTVLGGAREWMAHLTQLIFVWVAVLAMSAFVLRLGWSKGYAIVGALLLVALPPLLPMASTAMPDVLALAVGLVGMERLAAWKEHRKWRQGVAAAVALGLAGLARAHLALLLPLAAFFLVDSIQPRPIVSQIRHSLSLWIPVLAGGAVLVAALLATREGGFVLNPPDESFRGMGHTALNLWSYFFYFCFPLPLVVCWIAARSTTAPLRMILTIAPAAVIALMSGGSLAQIVWALVGVYALADLIWQDWKNQDQKGLFLTLWLLVPLPIVYYAHMPIKYLLPCMPALILVCFRLALALPAKLTRAAAVLVVLGGTTYSLLILMADAEFANFGRDALTTLIRPRVLAGQQVWSPGDFWAYWYASRAGATVIVPGLQEPRPGDLLAVGIAEGDASRLEKFPHRTLVQTLTHEYKYGRTMGDGAGLYSNYFGNLLWTWRHGDNARYELWRLD